MEDFRDIKIDPTRLPPLAPRLSGRLSTPRIEKGTTKVVDHEVREQASILLYALLHLCTKLPDTSDKNIASNLSSRITKDVDRVVADFGLDKDRLQTAGEKMGSDIMLEAEQARDLADLEAEYKALGVKLEAMKRSRLLDRESNTDQSVPTEVPGNKDGPSTRHGISLKRGREVEDAEACVNGMINIIKSMKSGQEGSRSRR